MKKRATKKKKVLSDEPDAALLAIDKNRLDWECARHPQVCFHFAQLLADVRLDFEEAKIALDVEHAELDYAIRSDPAEHGFEKITETSLKAYIATYETIQQQQAVILQAKHKVELYQQFVDGLATKTKMLQKLVDLHGQQYFSTPRVSAEAQEGIDRAIQRRTRKPRRPKE